MAEKCFGGIYNDAERCLLETPARFFFLLQVCDVRDEHQRVITEPSEEEKRRAEHDAAVKRSLMIAGDGV